MSLFLLGLVIFLTIHSVTALARPLRQAAIDRIGTAAYKGIFALIALISLGMVIRGWPAADTTILYTPSLALRPVTYGLMAIALILLLSAYMPAGKIAGMVKHPMLAAVKVWGFAHLLSNGEMRSVLLFGGFLAFAIIDRISLELRGEQGRPGGALQNDAVAIIVGGGVTVLIMGFFHQYIAGIALF